MLIGDPVEAALSRLIQADPIIRKLGAQTLARLRPATKLKEIQHAFAFESDPNVVKWLALALGNLGDPGSIPFLEEKKKRIDSSDTVDWINVAVAKLKRFYPTRVKDLLASSSPEAVRQAVAQCWDKAGIGKELERKLTKCLDHPDSGVRRWAALILGTGRFLQDATPILEGLSDSNYLVREWTECALSHIVDPNAYAQLVYRLEDSEPRVREWAIKALARYESPEIAEILAKRYHAESDVQCKEAIVRALANWTAHQVVRDFYANALALERNPVLLVAMIEALSSDSNLYDDVELIRLLASRCEGVGSEFISRELAAGLMRTASAKEVAAMTIGLKGDRGTILLKAAISYAEQSSRAKGSRKGRIVTSKIASGIVGLVIPLREELGNIKDLLGECVPVPDEEQGTLWYEFRLQSADPTGPFNCVAVVSGMGTERAGIMTERLIKKYRPSAVVNIGIAAGIDNDVKLCDVVVAAQVDNYAAFSKALPGKKRGTMDFSLSGDPFKADHFLTTRVADLELGFEQQYRQFEEEVSMEYNKSISVLQTLIDRGLMRQSAKILEVRVASGPAVSQSSLFNEWLKQHRDRSLKSLEMESAGVALAVHLQKTQGRALILRGISDFGDERKKELDGIEEGLLRRLAARNALRVLRQALLTVKPPGIM